MPIVVNPNAAPSSSQFPDWILPTSLDISYSKGGGSQFTKPFDLQLKDFIQTHGSGQLKILFTITSFTPATTELSPDFQFNVEKILSDTDFGKMYHLALTFQQINLMLAGVHTGNINIKVIDIASSSVFEEKDIPINLTIVDSGEITNNLSTGINFCLDEDLFFKLTSTVAKFVKVKYTILHKNKTSEIESLYALLNNEIVIPIGVPIQPYIYLSETDINDYFTNFLLDMKPAEVTIDVVFQDEEYQQITEYNLGMFLFHAGRSKNIPASGTAIERSLSFNSFLPLVYRYPGAMIRFEYKGNNKFFNKQQYSTPTSIFQTMLIQKYHFNEEVAGGFSPGFSGGFQTTEALLAADPFFLYEEGYMNGIHADYTIWGINLPWQINSWNVIWLDENNNFNGMCFTGDRNKERQIQQVYNTSAKDFRYKKAGTIKDARMKINSGWKLASEIPIFNSLIDAKRAWIFKNDPKERKEIICISDKFPEEIAGRELVEFNLEFIIND